jgi:hemerythrin
MSEIAEEIRTLNSTMDEEHRVQIWLIDALCKSVESGSPPAEVGRLLEQLTDYTKAHFMSEELLMRMDSYEGFDEHVEGHSHMLDVLEELAASHAAGNSKLIPGQAKSFLSFLVRHIETQDARYANAVKV